MINQVEKNEPNKIAKQNKKEKSKEKEREKWPIVEVFTDGSCSGNPGPGGWSYIMKCRGITKERCGGKQKTTNNQMELTAVVEALKALRMQCNVIVTTDSKYVTDTIQLGRLESWLLDGSLLSRPNAELWLELNALIKWHHVEFRWTKGHADNEDNNRCDHLAVNETKKYA